jgi:hypothetical protein
MKIIGLPKWEELATRPPGVFALAGEEVICHRGHPVGRFTRDVGRGQPPREDDFQFFDGHRPKEGQGLPACPICGGHAFNVRVQGERRLVEVHFRDGWRA